MHLTDAGPVSTGAPSAVQEEGGNDLTRGQGDGFADTCARIAMANFHWYTVLYTSISHFIHEHSSIMVNVM